jgi:tetratricopeptide (TPR) repeat protein
MAHEPPNLRRQRRERIQQLRRQGATIRQIAFSFAQRYNVSLLLAFRWAHQSTLEEACDDYNNTVADDPSGRMTPRRLSSYESWPRSTNGIQPKVGVLQGFAQVYQCAPGDLIDGIDSTDESRIGADSAARIALLPSQVRRAGPDDPVPSARPSMTMAERSKAVRIPSTEGQRHPTQNPSANSPPVSSVAPGHLNQIEVLRRGLHEAITEGAMTEAGLDDWELTALRYGQASRYRPAGMLLAQLVGDLAELKRAIQLRRSSSALRRLTRVTAQMSGLMCLTLVKLDHRSEFRMWARTARIAADEAGDPVTHSWVLAQEAYGHYYGGDLTDAIDVAGHAQDLVRNTPCVGAALAAALEARAHAALGRHRETEDALRRAETILARLDTGSLAPSAFGYNEAQFRFHEGNAYTHLRDTRSAWEAQERALELVPLGDYTDRTLTQLDRANCLVYDGDASEGTSYATRSLVNLTDQQREGIITLRACEIVAGLRPGSGVKAD